MKKNKIQLMCMTALFTALTFVVTFFANVPMGVGNVNLGDSMILLSGLFLPVLPVGFVGGVGAGLADLAGGYASFAPFTLVIKFLEGIILALLLKYFKNVISNKYVRFVLASSLAIIIMPIGYFFTNWFLFDLGGAVASLPHDFFQALMAVIISNIIFIPLSKIIKNHQLYV